MATDFTFLGPGSQPGEDDATLEFMELPKGMSLYRPPVLPEPEAAVGLSAGKAALAAVRDALAGWTPGSVASVSLDRLDPASLAFVDQAFGEGEVSIVCGDTMQVQESVLAGVWRVRETDEAGALVADRVEIGDFPASVASTVFSGATRHLAMPDRMPSGVFNAPALITEIAAKVAEAGGRHAINLSLLPHTEEDLTLLDAVLGRGPVTVLSRGYGNCRAIATGLQDVWWVRFYNSQDTLILNSIEITPVPDVVRAAPEDIADSRDRLTEILEAYR